MICYFNIRFSYRIRKVFRKYFYKYSKSWGEKVMKWRWICKDYIGWIEMWGRKRDTWWSKGARGLGCEYKECGNMRCFENPIVVSSSIIFNILYNIVEWFSFFHGCRYHWPNHVKSSCIIVLIVLFLCSWINIVWINTFTKFIFISKIWSLYVLILDHSKQYNFHFFDLDIINFSKTKDG